jgi:hypothetical protein
MRGIAAPMSWCGHTQTDCRWCRKFTGLLRMIHLYPAVEVLQNF